jgi:hypothetical protein|tara:strand:- start:188 stop:1615 length:1428 start_codon:yes stop_codon:yes gene_type:complete
MTSTIKVNTITTESGSTLTVGGCGKTVALASGASQTGFGRTGTVDWQTTKKTATFTAANGEGYFVDTSGGAVTMNLPSSPSAGDIVAFKDYSGDFSTNNLTIGRNGSNLDGSAADKAIDTAHTSMSLVYVDATQGWKSVEEGTGYIGESFITATGGTITTSGNCKIHTFTGPGNFTVSTAATSAANNLVSYLVLAGGGGGAVDNAGGGGGGGYREVKSPVTPYTASPLDGYPSAPNRITVSAQAYPITVGAGGAAHPGEPSGPGSSGAASTFSTISSAGGGGGGANPTSSYPAKTGGSGGGAGIGAQGPVPGPGVVSGASGNTPPVTPSQGNNGGSSSHSPGDGNGGGGGGGAGAVGGNAAVNPTSPKISGGAGGVGATTCISASPVGYGGGAGGSAGASATGGGGSPCGSGGFGGANTSGPSTRTGAPGPTPSTDSSAGATNRGGGGGSMNCSSSGSRASNGGSGVVIIRYKFQ